MNASGGVSLNQYLSPEAPVHIVTGAAGNREDLDGFGPEQPWSAVRRYKEFYALTLCLTSLTLCLTILLAVPRIDSDLVLRMVMDTWRFSTVPTCTGNKSVQRTWVLLMIYGSCSQIMGHLGRDVLSRDSKSSICILNNIVHISKTNKQKCASCLKALLFWVAMITPNTPQSLLSELDPLLARVGFMEILDRASCAYWCHWQLSDLRKLSELPSLSIRNKLLGELFVSPLRFSIFFSYLCSGDFRKLRERMISSRSAVATSISVYEASAEARCAFVNVFFFLFMSL